MADQQTDITKVKEHRYVLQDPFNYGSSSGHQEEAQFVLLKPPTSRNSQECARLKQAFFRAIDRETDGTSDGAPEKVEGADVIMTLAMSQKVDLAEVMDTAHHLFTKGRVALVDGEVPLTKPLLDQMSQEDVEGMLGDYLVVFTLASSLQRMKTKSSGASRT